MSRSLCMVKRGAATSGGIVSESKVVPRDSTRNMEQAALEMSRRNNRLYADGKMYAMPVGYELHAAGIIWRAMYDAAPPAVPDAPPMQGDDAELCSFLRGKRPLMKNPVLVAEQAAARIEQLSAHVAAFNRPVLKSEWQELVALVDQQKERIAELEKNAERYWPFVEMVGMNRIPRMHDEVDAYEMIRERKRAALAADREGETK